jgi:dethiobiotin synthetase
MRLFVTGTDTGVGKTYISAGLLRAFNKAEYSTLGLKPVASTCVMQNNKITSQDALELMAASSIKLPYDEVNPRTFLPDISPNIAAEWENQRLDARTTIESIAKALNHPADVHLIEGAGGWLVPLNDAETFADIAIQAKCKIVLVVGLKLGCMNHSILTYQAIKSAGLELYGWVANCVTKNMLARAENIATLKKFLPEPCLGVVNYQQPPEDVFAEFLQANINPDRVAS